MAKTGTMELLQFGIRLTGSAYITPSHIWLNSEKMRDETIEEVLTCAQSAADGELLEITKIIRRENDEILVGENSLTRISWRPIVLRTASNTRYAYKQQQAIVELYSGTVVVVDAEKPFTKEQYQSWPDSAVIEVLQYAQNRNTRQKPFWPDVRASNAEERGHYVVTNAEDLSRIRDIHGNTASWLEPFRAA